MNLRGVSNKPSMQQVPIETSMSADHRVKYAQKALQKPSPKSTNNATPSNKEAKKNVVFGIGFYALCSSSMLFFNKLSVSASPDGHKSLGPGPISCIQLGFANAFCVFLYVSSIDRFEDIFLFKVIKVYSLYCVLFVGSVYASMKALSGSNMETQIVFRSATPIAVAVLDVVFLGREVPSKKSICALVTILIFSLIYVATDAEFLLNGFAAYTWISIYFVLICASMTLGKHLMSAVKVGIWGSVALTNGLSLPMLMALTYVRGEFEGISEALAETTPEQWGIILAGCVTGTMIGWAGWYCRDLVSATSYTLIGVANKMFTILLGVFFLDKHASGVGILALVMSIVASTQYTQSPLRSKKETAKFNTEASEVSEDEEDPSELVQFGREEKQPLITYKRMNTDPF